MHILHVLLSNNPVPAIYGGAVQQTVQELAQECVKMGHKVSVISRAKYEYKEELEKITSSEKVNYLYVYSNSTSKTSLIKCLHKYIKLAIDNGPYDVIHTHVPYAAFFFYLFKNKLGNPKIIWHVHNNSKFSFLVKGLDIEIVGISRSVIRNLYGIIKKSKFSVIHNICRKGLFPLYTNESKLKYREEFSIEKSKYVITFAGRISPEKGLHVLLSAIEKMDEDIKSKITLLIAGASWFKNSGRTKYEEKLIEKAKQLDVRWLGYVDNWEMYKVYHASDIFVVPSVWEEPAGQVVIEAQSCGVKVIASDIGGIPEYLSPYDKKVEPNNPEKLSEAIIEILNKENSLEEAKKRSDWVNQNFSLNNIVKQWIQLYEK